MTSSSSNGLMLNGGGDPFRSNELFSQHQSANLPSSFLSLQHQHQLSLQQSRMQTGFHSAPTSSTFNPATLDVFVSNSGSAMLHSDMRSHTSSSFSGMRSPATTMFSEGRVSAPASAYPDARMPSSMYAAGQMPLMADRPDRLSQLEPMRRIDRIPISTSGDRLRQDAVFRDRVSGLAADEPQMRPQAVPQAQAQTQHMFSPIPTSPSQPTNNHEVRTVYIPLLCRSSLTHISAYQLLIPLAPVIFATLRPLCFAHNKVVRPAGVNLLTAEAQGRRCR